MVASTFYFSTPQSQTEENLPVSVSAAIDLISSTEMIVTLDNLEANPTAVDQVLTDFQFSIAANVSVTSITSSAQTITVSGKSPGDYTLSTGAVSSGWSTGDSNGSTTTFALCDIKNCGCFGQGASWPAGGLIGKPNSSNEYTGGGSITAGPHNPWLFYTVTFTIRGTNIPSAATLAGTVSNVVFGFGTTAGETAAGVEGAVAPDVPEPPSGTLWVVGICLIGVGTLRRRSR